MSDYINKAEAVAAQDNVHDGTPLIYEFNQTGAYVTVVGRHDADAGVPPTILALDVDDLKAFSDIYTEVLG